MIHRMLRRDDLARLVAEIAETDPAAGRDAAASLERGDVHAVLDSAVALEAVRGRGGSPAPLPLTLLWYVPVRADLRERGEDAVDLADFAATLPVAFSSRRAFRHRYIGEPSLATWLEAINAVPGSTIAQGERAVDLAALALWWAGCFPEHVRKRYGRGALRAFTDFAQESLQLAGRILARNAPDLSGLCHRAATAAPTIRETLHEVRADYLDRQSHDPGTRLDRFLARLRPTN